jgi:hypothetical protein
VCVRLAECHKTPVDDVKGATSKALLAADSAYCSQNVSENTSAKSESSSKANSVANSERNLTTVAAATDNNKKAGADNVDLEKGTTPDVLPTGTEVSVVVMPEKSPVDAGATAEVCSLFITTHTLDFSHSKVTSSTVCKGLDELDCALVVVDKHD